MIKVPIGRGIIGQVQQEFRKQPESLATTDLQFRKDLADEGKLVNNFGSVTGSNVVVQIIPPNGSTFYLLQATGISTSSGVRVIMRLRKTINGIVSTEVSKNGTNPINFDLSLEGFSLVGNGIDSVDVFSATLLEDYEASIFGYLEPSPTVGSRGTTSSL